MKQTNNAIKFLMAQYRAIFKNANLKMFLAAATAAAAMAATQAHAADFANKDLATAKGDIVLVGTGAAQGQFDNLTLTGGAVLPDSAENVVFKIQSGAGHTFKGTAQDAAVNLSSASLEITSSGTPAEATLTIGDDTTPASTTVTVGSISVNKGTLALEAKTDKEGTPTSVTANTITIGNEKGAANDAVVTVSKYSTLSATESLVINKEAKVTLAGGSLYGETTTMNGGSVALESGSTFGNAAKELTIKNGTVSVDTSKEGTIAGSIIKFADGTIENKATLTVGAKDKSFEMSGGALTNTAGNMTVASNATITGGTVTVTAGTATFAGTSTFGENATIDTKAGASLILQGNTTIESKTVTSVDGSILQLEKATAEMSQETLGKFLVGKVKAGGKDKNGIIALTDDTVNLGSGDKILKDTDGTVNKNFVANGGELIITGKNSAAVANYSGSDTINGDLTFKFETMNLGKDGALKLQGGADLVVGSSLTINGDATKGTGLTISSGSLTLDGASGSVSAKDIILAGTDASGAKLDVDSGTWEIPGLTVTQGTATVSGTNTVLNVKGDFTMTAGSGEVLDGAKLNVAGTLTTAAAGPLTADAGLINTFGSTGGVKLAASGVTLTNTSVLNLDAEDIFESGKNSLDKTKFEENAVAGGANTTIAINKDGKKLSLTKDEFTALQTAVGTSFQGLFDVDVTGITVSGSEMALDDVVSNIQTDAYNNVTATVDGTKDVSKVYSVGNIKVEADLDLNLAAGGALTLNHANADNQFVSKQSGTGTTVANVVFKDAANSLTLGGSGEIGSITSDADASGTLTIGSTSASGKVTVKGNIGTSDTVSIAGVTVNTGSDLVVSGSVFADKLDMREKTSLDVGTGSVVVENASIKGDVTAGTLTLSGTANDSHLIAGGADVNVGTLIVGGSGVLNVGMDGESGSTASVFTQNLDIQAGSKLFVDPDFKKPAAFVVTQDLKDTTGTDVGVLKGDIFVGKNAAFGYGFNETDFNSLMANYLNGNGAFDEKGIMQNALVVNKPLSIDDTHGVIVNPKLTQSDLATAVTSNTLKLASGGGLILTDAALSDSTKAAITFNGTTATVTADTGSVVSLFGEFTAKNTNMKFFDTKTTGSVTLTNDIHVEALGGMLEGTLTTAEKGTLKALTLSDKAKDIAYNGVSTPVGDLFMAVAAGDFVGSSGVGYDFVTGAMSNKQFKAVDAAAHAATYAGAQVAAVASVGTMAEAVGGRVGSMGVEAATIAATGSQATGGVWVSPMYKSVDADGFNAQGASYGADVDLAGVAFGADTVEGNSRYGVVFNIGSGESEGKGNGQGLKDDFDYYGIGIYSARAAGNFAVVADASLNVISHDVEGLGLKGSAETMAFTAGLTGQYTMSSPMVDVTPHLGARLIRLDTDSYDLTSADGIVATTDFDVQNVFSVPLGVTLSKAFEMGGWTLAPNADLTIAFNAGDTDAESTTRFSGVNRNIGLTTEVLDEVTYGVAVGLGAQYGSFGTSFGINYTGSENTDALGVNAQARYMF